MDKSIRMYDCPLNMQIVFRTCDAYFTLKAIYPKVFIWSFH